MSLAKLGEILINIAQFLSLIAYYVFTTILIVVIVLIVLRVIVDALKLSPFGKFAYYTTKPANRMIGNMRNSQFYYPLKRAFGFDPALLMVFVAAALFCYLGYILVGYINTILWALANSLITFGAGNIWSGSRYLLGTILISAIIFLLTLMLFMVLSSWFGIFPKLGQKADLRMRPLLRLFDFGGMWTPFAFIFLMLALNLALSAVQMLFLSDLRMV